MQKKENGCLLYGLTILYCFLIFASFIGYYLGIILSAGGETVTEIIEENDSFTIRLALLSLITFFIVKFAWTKKRRAFSYGIMVIYFIFILIYTIPYYSYRYIFPVKFDKGIWTERYCKPFNMAASLVKYEKLIGLSSSNVDAMLNKPTLNYRNTWYPFKYSIENYWEMKIIFDNDTVSRVLMSKGYTAWDGDQGGECDPNRNQK